MSFFSKKTIILSVLFLFFVHIQISSGVMLLKVQDTLSDSAPSTYANHTVKFTTNSSIPAGGEVDFELQPGYFHIPESFDHEDVDLLIRLPEEDSYEQRNLGLFVSGTTSAVSVSSGVFGSVTITLAEEVPAGSRFEIRLGTHAEHGSEGSVGIYNPSVAQSYEFFLETKDTSGSRIDNAKGMVAIVEPVTTEFAFDLDFPVRYNGLPEGELPGDTDKATVSLNTDIYAICRFDTEPGVEYHEMAYSFSADYRLLHSYEIDYLENEQEYTFYVRCMNVIEEYNFDDYEITFSVAPAPTDQAEPGDPEDEPDDSGGTGDSPGSGGGSGGGTGSLTGPGDGEEYPPHTGLVIIEGRAYPASRLFVLKDGSVIFDGNSEAEFSRTVGGIEYGGYTFSVYVEDPSGVRSMSKHSTITIRSNTTNRISNIFLPPTVSPKDDSVEPGGTVDFHGYSFPDSEVQYEILNGGTVAKSGSTQSQSDGSWSVPLDTDGLGVGTYTFQARTAILDGDRSSDWERVLLGIGVEPEDSGLTADLNRDGKVNLADFSILLFHWGTSSSLADINGDGEVGLADFSIMLFQWTG